MKRMRRKKTRLNTPNQKTITVQSVPADVADARADDDDYEGVVESSEGYCIVSLDEKSFTEFIILGDGCSNAIVVRVPK